MYEREGNAGRLICQVSQETKYSHLQLFLCTARLKGIVFVGHKCPLAHRCTQVCAHSLKMTELLWKMVGILIRKNEEK